MEYLAIYLLIAVLFMGFWSVRCPNERINNVFVACMIWPVSIILMICVLISQAIGWNFDIKIRKDKLETLFGFRHSPNPNARGWAVRIHRAEFQLYSAKKEI